MNIENKTKNELQSITDNIKVKSQSPIVRLIIAILLLIAGILCITLSDNLPLYIALLVTSVLIMIYSIWVLITKLLDGRIALAIIEFAILLGLGISIICFSNFFASIIFTILGILAFAIAALRIFIIIHLATVQGPGIPSNVISAILCIIFGILMFAPFSNHGGILEIICGIYLILFSITFFGDFFAGLTKADMKDDRKKRRFHFALPNFITAYQSTGLIKKYNKLLQNHPEYTKQVTVKEDAEYTDVNFSVLIHVSQILAKRMGHVDIAIGDTVYTYGCYDSSQNKLGGMISKGTFCVLPKEPYIKNCLIQQRKYVIEYGLHLSQEQLNAVDKRIDEIFKQTTLKDISYDPTEDKEGNDGANTVAKLGGKLYYVNDGPFKTYFAISSNCVQLADTIIGTTGLDVMSKNSLRTPGAYYRMMEHMFKRKGTRVVSKIVYLQNEPGEKERLEKEAMIKKKK